MSSQKFTPVTSTLLVRKGEAKPSMVPKQSSLRGAALRVSTTCEAAIVPMRTASAEFFRAPRPIHSAVDHAAPEEKRRIVVTLHMADFERLGIIAVKHKTTHAHLVHDLLLTYLDEAASKTQECRCLASGEGDCT